MMKSIFVAAVVAAMASSPALADGVPSAGFGGGQLAAWQALPIGTQVVIGGILFVVVAGGLALADDDDKKKVIIPTPTPTPTPTTTTTTTTTTT